MRLIITRHGETEENKAGVIQGHLPGKLTSKGIDQAKKLALRLKDEKIDYIYSSDLARAADTAKEIAKFHTHPLEFTDELREQHTGIYTGRKMSDFGLTEKNFAKFFINTEGGETLSQLYTRADKFVHKILQKHNKQTVLLVAHNGVNKALIAVITGKTAKELEDFENQLNTAVNIFEISEDRKHKIHCLNCVKHLDKSPKKEQ